MPKLIKNGRIVADDWQVLQLAEGQTADTVTVPAGPVFVPLDVWQARRDELATRGDVAVWLAGTDAPEALADDLAQLPAVAVHFPKFTDGRGYSVAVLLRTRHCYAGELRAIGEVLRDQFNYMTRCGFDALQPKEGKYDDAQLEAAVASIADFSQPYQASVLHQQPLFRRVARVEAA